MMMHWSNAAGPSILAAFLASLVECVEALTVVLAVGSVRGWTGVLTGAASAIALLLAILVLVGHALTRVPLQLLQGVVGALLLLFGLRWLRKAILRSAGYIAKHDEAAAFAKNTAAMQELGMTRGWDVVGFGAAFQITMLEGTEVIFIVIAIGAGGAGLLAPASLGALAALIVVAALGLVLHRPLARVPENTLKYLVGVLLSAFGTFWVGESIGIRYVLGGGEHRDRLAGWGLRHWCIDCRVFRRRPRRGCLLPCVAGYRREFLGDANALDQDGDARVLRPVRR
jgi:uncharacterized membrane protein